MPQLIVPDTSYLASYVDALARGWSPETLRREDATGEHILRIESAPMRFIRSLDDPEGLGPPIELPDGSAIPRLPSITRWVWADEFAGSINLRWQKGTSALPEAVLGHIGFSIVPWCRGRGLATFALGQMLPEAKKQGLGRVELTTSIDNVASQRVLLANGAELIGRFTRDSSCGCSEALRYRIDLS